MNGFGQSGLHSYLPVSEPRAISPFKGIDVDTLKPYDFTSCSKWPLPECQQYVVSSCTCVHSLCKRCCGTEGGVSSAMLALKVGHVLHKGNGWHLELVKHGNALDHIHVAGTH